MVVADEEREWVRRAREGDPQAYRLLVERYESRIYRLVARLLGPGHGGIEDVVQEVFVKAYFSLKKFREEASFGTWIYRIAVNRTRDELKKESAKMSFEESIPRASIQALSGLFQNADSDEEDPPEPPGALRQFVGRAVAALPERLRVVVTLKDMEGLSYREVSRLLKCSVGTVKSRHARAREKLREALSPYVPELQRVEKP
ncbi:MAG: sigma-70 family RNA polymerase sigma factor [Nitrospinota bacterium]